MAGVGDLPKHEVYALRYATRSGTRASAFIGGDAQDAPLDMDYYVWLIVGPEGPVVIDTGFNHASGARRGRSFTQTPIEALRALGHPAETVERVILTHLHYDHAGNVDAFPKAQFFMHEKELAYVASAAMGFTHLRQHFEVEDVCAVQRLLFAGRLELFSGASHVLAPGIELHWAGGHSAGLSCVRVSTEAGWLLIASDICHYMENLTAERPFPVAYSVAEMLNGFTLARRLADRPELIIPGHDPCLRSQFPIVPKGAEGSILRLDQGPL